MVRDEVYELASFVRALGGVEPEFLIDDSVVALFGPSVYFVGGIHVDDADYLVF